MSIGGVSMIAEKRVRLIDEIRSKILANTNIQNKELAKQIAREWLRKGR